MLYVCKVNIIDKNVYAWLSKKSHSYDFNQKKCTPFLFMKNVY